MAIKPDYAEAFSGAMWCLSGASSREASKLIPRDCASRDNVGLKQP